MIDPIKRRSVQLLWGETNHLSLGAMLDCVGLVSQDVNHSPSYPLGPETIVRNSGLEVPTKKYLFNSGVTQLYLKKINCCQGSTHPHTPPFFFGKPAGCTQRHPSDPTIPGPSLSRSLQRSSLEGPIGVWRGTLLSSKMVMIGHAKCTKVSKKKQGLSVERD